jgi:predicted acylesterase/phospholipase RssA
MSSVEQTSRNVAQEPFALVMKGGSVKGLAYVWAVRELEKYYRFNWYIGTSAGAIAAVLLAAGYSTDELETILSEKNFLDFLDAKFYQLPLNLILHKGLFPADALTDWIDCLLAKKLASPTRVRLSDLPRHVTVYACRRDEDTLVFDSQSPATKGTFAAFAIRCSMAIPYVFTPQLDQGMRVRDGGMRNNYPVEALLRDHPDTRFIGLYLGPRTYEGNAKKQREGSQIGEFFSIWMESPDLRALQKYRSQTVIIDPRPITTLSFKLSQEEKRFLLSAGRGAAFHFLVDKPLPGGSPGPVTREQADQADREVEAMRKSLVRKRVWRRRRDISLVAALLIAGALAFLYPQWRAPKIPDLSNRNAPAGTGGTPTAAGTPHNGAGAVHFGGQFTQTKTRRLDSTWEYPEGGEDNWIIVPPDSDVTHQEQDGWLLIKGGGEARPKDPQKRHFSDFQLTFDVQFRNAKRFYWVLRQQDSNKSGYSFTLERTQDGFRLRRDTGESSDTQDIPIRGAYSSPKYAHDHIKVTCNVVGHNFTYLFILKGQDDREYVDRSVWYCFSDETFPSGDVVLLGTDYGSEIRLAEWVITGPTTLTCPETGAKRR